jgi:hypothetical protein
VLFPGAQDIHVRLVASQNGLPVAGKFDRPRLAAH